MLKKFKVDLDNFDPRMLTRTGDGKYPGLRRMERLWKVTGKPERIDAQKRDTTKERYKRANEDAQKIRDFIKDFKLEISNLEAKINFPQFRNPVNPIAKFIKDLATFIKNLFIKPNSLKLRNELFEKINECGV